ncbi:MAG: prepilin-type N-terminal cleavage/methylation domain-containing protein [Rickettsiales bacterium]|nr:prepilin-type N-terminal cleavage/methylation domain-containing protein [Rickettsiales bacterium]
MRRGFSLVELSIVLVILGLLVGGVLAGQSLIRAAELRSVITQSNNFRTAAASFKDKYFAIPGDMINATQFWGTMSTGTCPNATAGTSTQTCNGNGDGQIGTGNLNSEMALFWQHMANAGLIEGSYSGYVNGGIWNTTNTPFLKISNALWNTVGRATMAISSTQFIEGDYGNTLEAYIGSVGAVLRPDEQWNMDTKIDDGRPATGLMRAQELGGANCITVAGSNSVALASTAAYNLSFSGVSCHPVFPNIW